jgi:flagellar hook-associated protein 3 FlgL
MISSLRPSDEVFLANTQRLNKRIETASRQINSGKRIQTISDDPDQIGTLFATRSQIGRMEQISRNLTQVKTEVDTAEGALQAGVRLMDRAAQLAAQGASGFSNAQSRGVLANEIDSLLDSMLGLTQTTAQGRFIFSGDSDQLAPYSSLTSGYAGSAATRQAVHPNGHPFPTARNAQDIFDNSDAARNVFQSLTAARDALRANDDAAIAAAQPGLRSAADHLNEQLAFYGTAQGRIAEATSLASTETTRLRVQLSAIEDTDLLAASLELNTASRDYQAALQARAKADRGSLFDYLG